MAWNARSARSRACLPSGRASDFSLPIRDDMSGAAEHLAQLSLVAGVAEGLLVSDGLGLVELLQGLVHRVHAKVAAIADAGVEVARLAFLQLLFDGRRGGHHLDRRQAARPVGPVDQSLGRHAEQRARQLLAYLALEVFGKTVDDPVYGGRRRSGVQRGQHEVADLGGRHRYVHRLLVPQLADGDHVRALAHDAVERRLERAGVEADLPLMDYTLLIHEKVFDRVFDGKDIGVAAAVDLLDESG